MHAPGKQLTRIFLAGLAVSSLTLGMGCDSESGKADKDVTQSIQAAAIKAQEGGDTGLAGAISDLEKAAGNTVASIPVRAQAKAALAQGELNAANLMLRQIDEKEVSIAGELWAINQLGSQIQAGNLLASAYQKREPKAERDAIQAKLDEARGGAGKDTWFSQDKEKSSIPTLAAVKQEVSRLEGEISKNQDQLKSLTDQRSQLLADADKFTTAAEGGKGQDAVKAYKDGSDARRKAADLAVQMDNINAALVPLQADLAVAQGQQKTVEAAVAAFEGQLKEIDDSWAEIQKQSDAQLATSRNLMQASGETDNSITARAARVGKLVAESRTLRDSAEQNLNNSIKHFEDAAKEAESLKRELQTAINDARDPVLRDNKNGPWALLQDAINPSNYRLQMGNAQLQLATLYADRASSLTARGKLADSLSPVLVAAKLTIPQELNDPSVAQDQKTARTLANSNFQSTVETLSTVSQSSASPEMRSAAQVALMTAYYAWSQSASAAGETDQATQHMRDAIQARDAAKQMEATIPVLPDDIAPAAPAAPATPTTSPATTPAT